MAHGVAWHATKKGKNCLVNKTKELQDKRDRKDKMKESESVGERFSRKKGRGRRGSLGEYKVRDRNRQYRFSISMPNIV